MILSGQEGFIILRGGQRGEPSQRLAVGPGHPLSHLFRVVIKRNNAAAGATDSRETLRGKATPAARASPASWPISMRQRHSTASRIALRAHNDPTSRPRARAKNLVLRAKPAAEGPGGHRRSGLPNFCHPVVVL